MDLQSERRAVRGGSEFRLLTLSACWVVVDCVTELAQIYAMVDVSAIWRGVQ